VRWGLLLLWLGVSSQAWGADVAALRREANEAYLALEAHLGSNENADAWRRYLRCDEICLALAERGLFTPARAERLLEPFLATHAGLEQDEFVACRDALDAYTRAATVPEWGEIDGFLVQSLGQASAPSAEGVEQGRQQLRQALRGVDEQLRGWRTQGAGWRDYLQWPKLTQLTEDESTSDETWDLLLKSWEPGSVPEHVRPFAQARFALLNYRRLTAAAQYPDLTQWVDQHLQELRTLCGKPTEQLTADDQGVLAAHLAWLDAHGQVAPVQEALRHHLAQPNFRLRAARRLVVAGLERDVDEWTDVRDVILGTSITGRGKVRGRVTFELVPAPDQAILELTFRGTIDSNTLGTNGPARLRTNSLTKLESQKRVLIREAGIADEAATAWATTDSRTGSVWSKFRARWLNRLVTKVARRKIAEASGQSEQIASRHAERDFRERLDRELEEQLAEGKELFEQKLRGSLREVGAYPDQFRFFTTREALHISLLQARGDQLGAQTAPPARLGQSDLDVQLHETFVNNSANLALAGKQVDSTEVRTFLAQNMGSLPESFDTTEEKAFSITFAPRDPISVRFADDRMHLVIRGQQFTSGNDQYNFPVDIEADYRIGSKEDGRIVLERTDRLVIQRPDRKPLGGRYSVFRTVLRRRFEKLLEPQLVLEPFDLPEGWAKLGQLAPEHLEMQQGWMTLGYGIRSSGG
jgi:hypothetical protein